MERVLAKHIVERSGEKVRLRGWLHTLRPLGKLNFLVVRDMSGLAQVVIEDKEELKKLKGLQPGSVLDIEGLAVKSSEAELGAEVTEPKITVEVPVRDVPPIEYSKPDIPSDLEFILDHRTLSVRNRKIQAVFKIQAEIAHAYRVFMHDWEHAVEYFPPNILGASSEGGAEFFSVDYFGHTATLAQSSQLYKQIMVGVNEKVFAIVPFFRAEPSHTTRHLTEGKQLEFEMGFFEDWHEVLDVEERALKFIVNYVKEHCASELKLLGAPLAEAPEDVSFPRVTFAEAQQIFFDRTGIDERNEPDLSPAAERELCRYAKESFGTDFIFVIDWRLDKRPFYSYPNEDEPKLTNTFDLLCCGTEITSGGQRRHTYDSMVEGLKLKGMDPSNFTDYLDVFKYGMPPHGGFGIGLERLTMTLLGLKNIREVSLFPSDPKRIASNRLKAKIFFGGENIRGEIVRILKDRDVPFKHMVHEATPTSEDSARVRNTKLEEGVKTLILKGKQSKKNVCVNIPSHKKVDMKAVANAVGEKCEFESPEVIQERFGLIIGGVPPFGNLLNLETYFDDEIATHPVSAFNCGLPTESVVMQSKDLIDLVQPKMGVFSKN